jgi:hypothetical protein
MIQRLMVGSPCRHPYRNYSGVHNAARSLYNSCGLNHSGIIDKGKDCQFFPWTGSLGIRTLLMCAKADDISASDRTRQGPDSLT